MSAPSRAAAIRTAAILAAATLAGCMVGPDYHRPSAPVSAQFKELKGWKPSQPSDAVPRGAWWTIYRDPVLDGLERQVAISNQTLKQAEAAYRSAAATVTIARAQLFPTVGLTSSVERRSGNTGGTSSLTSSAIGNAGTSALSTGTGTTPVTTSGSGVGNGTGSGGGTTRTVYTVEGTVDWEIDLWGRIRRQVESDVAAAQASAGEIQSALLSAQGALAIDYFELRAADSLDTILSDTVRDYQRSLQITQNQYGAGTAARADVITAQTQLAGAQSSLINVGVQRATLEHAIAVLIGRPPSDLTIPPAPLANTQVPVLPPGIPSALLERRPDIATAERQMQQQNALVGAAIAAFYPQVTLSALYGYFGSPLSSLISTANRVWSLGASADQTLFEGGARTGAVAQARADYDGSVANYRQVVLTAFQGVEDQLATLRILGQQLQVAEQAVALARRAVEIALNQYRAGTVAYTTVVTDQAILLTDQQAALTVRQNLFIASATLIEDLGGGWTTSDLPSKASLQSFDPLLP